MSWLFCISVIGLSELLKFGACIGVNYICVDCFDISDLAHQSGYSVPNCVIKARFHLLLILLYLLVDFLFPECYPLCLYHDLSEHLEFLIFLHLFETFRHWFFLLHALQELEQVRNVIGEVRAELTDRGFGLLDLLNFLFGELFILGWIIW